MSIKPQRYEKDWAYLPSVTEVLDIIAKPELMAWMRRTSAEDIKRATETATDIGKVSHDAIGRILLKENFNIETEYSQEVSSCVNAFIQWSAPLNLKVLECELKMKSDKLGYKGTLDHILINAEDKKLLVDWKTSKAKYILQAKESHKAVWAEHELQLVAYKKLYEENGGKIDELWCVSLGKDEPIAYPHKIDLSREQYLFDIFNHALQLKKWQKENK